MADGTAPRGAHVTAVVPPSHGHTLGTLVLTFSDEELYRYLDSRLEGLAKMSRRWVITAAHALWDATNGEISQASMGRLRSTILTRYRSQWSHGKTLGFVRAFLRYLTRVRLDSRYSIFEIFLEKPKRVKERMAITPRIVTAEDIQGVLAHIKRAEQSGELSEARAREFEAFTLFGAYTGQRPMSTTDRLTVGQFREALERDKPVLYVAPDQDKIRMAHFVPLHDCVVDAVRPLLSGRDDTELMFKYRSLYAWIRRRKITMSKFKGCYLPGDLRKFAEQYGDIIGWDQSNRAYILTHGVSGVDWSHYKHPLPENVYSIYMKSWKDVALTCHR
ncbi:MAG: hypothetical protein ACXVIU_12700 [Halobacteriota archaeon]